MLSEPEARQHCGPIFFTRSLKRASKEDIITNGSFGLVDTGTKKLLVTCNHVWEGFDEEHFKDANVKMCVCLDSKNPVYLDEKHLIDHDKQADLATFDMTELLSACGGLKFFNIRSKPPPKVKRGDIIFLIGFPGHGRNAGGDFIAFNRNPFGMIVSSVDGNRFHANVENIPWEVDKYGGISGCPAFLISAGRANELQLAGFAMGVWMKQLMFTHAGQLLPDGTIKR